MRVHQPALLRTNDQVKEKGYWAAVSNLGKECVNEIVEY